MPSSVKKALNADASSNVSSAESSKSKSKPESSSNLKLELLKVETTGGESELEEGEIIDDDDDDDDVLTHSKHLSKSKSYKQKTANDVEMRAKKIKGECEIPFKEKNKTKCSPEYNPSFCRYLVKKSLFPFNKEEGSNFIGMLMNLTCDKAVECPDFDPRIILAGRMEDKKNALMIQCENIETARWIETVDFSSLFHTEISICTKNDLERILMDMVRINLTIPIIPGSRIRAKEEIIPIFKGTNRNKTNLNFDNWKIKVYEPSKEYINISIDVGSEDAKFLRKNNTLSFGPSKLQLDVM